MLNIKHRHILEATSSGAIKWTVLYWSSGSPKSLQLTDARGIFLSATDILSEPFLLRCKELQKKHNALIDVAMLMNLNMVNIVKGYEALLCPSRSLSLTLKVAKTWN